MNTWLDKISQRKIGFFVLFAVSTLLIFWNISHISLWSPDEPRFAAIVRHMIDENEYIIPKLNGEPLPWKPILVYWLMAIPAKATGEVSSLTSRLPSALSALGILFLLYWFIKKNIGRKIAFFASLILITNYTFLEQAKCAIIDMTLTLFMLLALIFFYLGYTEKKDQKLYYTFVYIACGLAMLAKGPVGVIVPFLVIFVFLICEKRLSHLKEFIQVRGILFFAVTVIPWFIAACLIGGKEYESGVRGYAYELIIRQNVIRFFHAFDHIQPFYYYVDRVFTHYFPWSLLLPAAIILFLKDFKRYKQSGTEKIVFYRFIWVWFLSVFFFFSFSKSKRSQYILLLYPAMSFIVAHLCCRFFDRKEESVTEISLNWIKVPVSFICIILGIFFMAFPSFVARGKYFEAAFFKESIPWSMIFVFLVIYTGSVFAGENKWSMGKTFFPRFLILSIALYSFMVISLYPQLDRIRSAIPTAQRINQVVGNERLITFYIKRPEFIFYLDRGIIEVLQEDEVGKLIEKLRKRDEKVFCLIRRRYYNDRVPYLRHVRHKIVLNDLKGWKWDFLLISN